MVANPAPRSSRPPFVIKSMNGARTVLKKLTETQLNTTKVNDPLINPWI